MVSIWKFRIIVLVLNWIESWSNYLIRNFEYSQSTTLDTDVLHSNMICVCCKEVTWRSGHGHVSQIQYNTQACCWVLTMKSTETGQPVLYTVSQKTAPTSKQYSCNLFCKHGPAVCCDTSNVTVTVSHCRYVSSAVDKSLSSSLSDARDALINAVVDMLTAYHSVQSVGQSSSQLLCPYQLRHAALCVLAMLKSVSSYAVYSGHCTYFFIVTS